MASQLRVDEIIASTGSSVAIGTAGESVTISGEFSVDASKGLNVGTGATIFSPSSNVLTLGTNSAERVRINSSGSVGIGTNNPDVALHILSNTTGFKVQRDDESLSINPNYAGQSHCAFELTNALSIRTGSGSQNERLRITNTGNVGIGTDNPSRKLHVNSGSIDTAALFYSSDAGCYINYQDSTSGAGNGVNIGCVGDDIRFGSGAGGEYGRITSAGNVQIANGNLVFSTSGTGIDFSATGNGSGTMSSELLDDYEEGDWTPLLRGRNTAGTTVNNRTAVGKYTKVGRMVNVVCDIDQTCTGGTGDMQISGLPYAAHTGPYVRFMGPIHWERMPFAYSDVQIVAFLNDNNDYVWIGSSRSNTTGDLLNITSNQTAMQFSITYMTD